jgi:hypothetical protein
MKKIFKKKRTFWFIILIFLTLLVLDFFYILNDLQGNKLTLFKYRYINPNLNILPYSQVSKIIKNKMTVSRIIKVGDDYKIKISEFPPLSIQNVSEKLNEKTLPPTYRLGLYGMYYGIDLLREYDRTGDKKLLEKLRDITEIVLNKIETFNLMPEPFHFNDHAVSERVEFLLLFRAKLEEMEGYRALIEQIERHILYCVSLLLDDRRFNWIGNHGTMQIRAILHIASAMPESELGKECMILAQKRIKQVFPLFIADDGAILEAASGYWLYIFRQWDYISKMKVLPNDTRSYIKKGLINAKEFIETVIIPNGFMQGVGDSFNQTVNDTTFTPKKENQVFSFSNGLAGLNFKVDSIYYQLLFVSLDTQPNVHKLPEDLALYLYAGEPFFINTGTYAYGKSPGRKYVKSERSQSTVSFLKPSKLNSSRITDLSIDKGALRIRLAGKKWYKNDSINRTINVFTKNGIIEIIDMSDSDKDLSSRFNLHPNIKVQKARNGYLILKGRNGVLTIEYEGQLKKNSRWVSLKMMDQTPITQLEFVGNPVRLKIKIPPDDYVINSVPTLAAYYSQRHQIAENLSNDYKGWYDIKILTASRLFLLISFIISAAIFRINKAKTIGMIFITIICFLLVVDIMTNGYCTYSIYLKFKYFIMQYR